MIFLFQILSKKVSRMIFRKCEIRLACGAYPYFWRKIVYETETLKIVFFKIPNFWKFSKNWYEQLVFGFPTLLHCGWSPELQNSDFWNTWRKIIKMQILFLRKFEFSKVKEIRNENVRSCFQNIGNRLDETEKHKPPIWNSSNIWTKNEYFSNLMFCCMI